MMEDERKNVNIQKKKTKLNYHSSYILFSAALVYIIHNKEKEHYCLFTAHFSIFEQSRDCVSARTKIKRKNNVNTYTYLCFL